VDATPLHQPQTFHQQQPKAGGIPAFEEYTLPDLFPQSKTNNYNNPPSIPQNNNHLNNNKKYYQVPDGGSHSNYSQNQAYGSSSSSAGDLISPTAALNNQNNNGNETSTLLNGHYESSTEISLMSFQRQSPSTQEEESEKANTMSQPEPYGMNVYPSSAYATSSRSATTYMLLVN
jgi:hypothetical protein